MRLALVLLLTTLTAQAQWDIEDSHTTASLRGIHNVGGGVAWASGTNGTVLRTEDGGYLWQGCATPPGAEKLDFRGIQAFDENTAIVMSSGKGDLSRLYKTTDGCRTWKLVFTNPDKDGFWDAIKFDRPSAILVGDPVRGKFFARISDDNGKTWHRSLDDYALSTADPAAGMFAASNSIVTMFGALIFLVANTDGKSLCFAASFPTGRSGYVWGPTDIIPMATGSPSRGVFSLALAQDDNRGDVTKRVVTKMVAVGGDYKEPDETNGTAAFSLDYGEWFPSKNPPHGYRSAVAYDPTTKTWITVGPNGTDISRDDGKNWTPLKPTQAEPQDADKNWNALSLPFVVGPNGRIGKLRPSALKP
jgi:hypothetical protein